MQEEFSDLFVQAIKSKATYTVYAEFLPNAAVADSNGSPWGQYGNREIPSKRKLIVVSFNAIADLPFLEIKKIDEVARFLKRAGFTVLIPVGNELQNYERQLFDRENITWVGNKTRNEMQKMVLARNIPEITADDIFFIDDVKKEVDENFLSGLLENFQRIEYKKPTRENSYAVAVNSKSKSPIPVDVGIILINEHGVFPRAPTRTREQSARAPSQAGKTNFSQKTLSSGLFTIYA